MARFDVVQPQQQARGANNQLMGMEAVNTASAGQQQALEGVQQAGRALSGLGMTFAAIQKKKQQAIDLKSEMAIRADYNATKADIAKFQSEKPPGLWDEYAESAFKKSYERSNQYEMTENARAMVVTGIYGSGDGEQRIYGEVDTDKVKVGIDAIKRQDSDNRIIADASYYSAMTLYNPNIPEEKAKIEAERQIWYKSRANQSQKLSEVEENQLIANATVKRQQNLALSDLQNIAIKSGWEESLKKINDPAFQRQYNLSSDDIGELSTRMNQQKNIAEETDKLEVEKQNTEIGDAILNGDTTVFDKIKNSSLSYDQKKKWTQEVKSLSGRDEEIYNDLLTKISQEPDKYDSTYLASFITKGINGEDYKDLNSILTSAKTKDRYQKVIHSQYASAINDMQTRKLFNSGTSEQDKLDNINKATRSMIALENWAKKNPNATSDQYQAFFKTLTMPNISSYGVRISEDERQEIIANTGIDLYDGLDLFGFVSGVEGVKAQAEIDKKREALLNENILPVTDKRKENESIDDYIKRTTTK